MNGLFLFLFLVSIVCLIVGLIQPIVLSRLLKDKANRKFIGIFFGIATILFFILFGTTSSKSTPTTNPATTTDNTPSKTETLTPSYSFDIPSLLGKNIDEVRQVLGTPLDKNLTEPTAEQLKLGADEWDNSYKKGNQELLVTFNPITRKIVDFFLSGDNKAKLIEAGNLKENDSNYTIEQVKQLKNPSAITGIKITPKQ